MTKIKKRILFFIFKNTKNISEIKLLLGQFLKKLRFTYTSIVKFLHIGKCVFLYFLEHKWEFYTSV